MDPPRLDLDEMRMLVVIADELHVGRAAARLNLSQPGLSYRIKRMEKSLGFDLLARVGRGVQLTPAGAAVVDGAHRVLHVAGQVVTDGEKVARGEAATVRLGFVGTALYTVVPALLREVGHRHPDLHLVLEERKTASLVQALQAGTVDLALVHLPIGSASGLAAVPAKSSEVGLAVPAHHRLAGRSAVDLADMAAEDVILFPRELEPQTHDRYVDACVQAGFAPRVAHRATGLQTILAMVAAGMGIAFVAESVARSFTRTGVSFVPLTRHAPVLTLGPAWREPLLGPGVVLLRDLVLEVCAEPSTHRRDLCLDADRLLD